MQSSLLSHDWLTADYMFKWVTDILEWLVISLRQWRVATDQMISCLLNGPGTDHLNEWFVADWIVEGLAYWLNNFSLIELSGDWPTDWMICCWLNCLGTDQLTEWFVADWIVWGLTNWLNDLWPTAEFAQSWKVIEFHVSFKSRKISVQVLQKSLNFFQLWM